MPALFLLCGANAAHVVLLDDGRMLREITRLMLLPTALSAALCAALASASDEAQQTLPLPAVVNDGDTISLRCGQIYRGTLDLRGRRDITVRTEGDCGKAAITPSQPVREWVRDGRGWSAPIGFEPLMLQLGEQFMSLAHHPNGANEWLSGQGAGPDRLRVTIPRHDLVGATLVWRPEDWLILSQRIVQHGSGQVRIASLPEPDFGFRDRTPYYLEGQRWMLDRPGEWVYDNGRIFLWTPDGRSPEGRVWAAPRATAIDARGSDRVRIVGVRIFLAARGIDGNEASALTVTDTDIVNSFDEAIRIGGEGARMVRVRVRGTRQHGIRAEDDARDVHIADSVFERIGMLGMPLRSKGAIVFEQARGQVIVRNRIDQSAYLGIRVFREAIVTDNVITRACQWMTDCGGIYTFARDRLPLSTRIERNRISGLRGRLSHAIYLDDFANGVIVRDNRLTDNPGGMQLHDAFDNLITGNRFSRSAHEHLLFNETSPGPSITGNQVSHNRFDLESEVPAYRLWSHHGGHHLRRFAVFINNRYRGKSGHVAQLEGSGWANAPTWRERMDEIDPVFSASAALPQLARQPAQK